MYHLLTFSILVLSLPRMSVNSTISPHIRNKHTRPFLLHLPEEGRFRFERKDKDWSNTSPSDGQERRMLQERGMESSDSRVDREESLRRGPWDRRRVEGTGELRTRTVLDRRSVSEDTMDRRGVRKPRNSRHRTRDEIKVEDLVTDRPTLFHESQTNYCWF